MPEKRHVEESLAEERAPRLSLMLIDDDDGFRESLASVLEDRGHSVVRCVSAARALTYLRTGPLPDVIIFDLLMPDKNGWQFRVEQKRESHWASIPVIAISGDHSAKAESIDAMAYFSKPIDEQRFFAAVERIGKDLYRRRIEARAGELERLISLGALVGGIAHEINNPLAYVAGNLDLLEQQLLGTDSASATAPSSGASPSLALANARAGIERITSVLRCVSLFTSSADSAVEPLDIHEVLESSLQVADNEIRHCAKLERAYQDVPHVRGNAAKLAQVFLNIILNAVSAIREADEREHVIRVSTSVHAEMVVVTVYNTAHSLSAASLASLFDPLASIHLNRAGLHFGLAISREVVESMGGSIEVEAAQPRGATFHVQLPRCTRASYPAPALRQLPRPASIVVIDDEPLLCELFAAMLRSADYTVTTFASPRAALAALLGGNVDLILCDVMMPDMRGDELYAQLCRERPEMASRFVFITGGAFTERARSFLKRTDRPILQKPCSRSELLDAVGHLLASDA